jgi:hypothetical protein
VQTRVNLDNFGSSRRSFGLFCQAGRDLNDSFFFRLSISQARFVKLSQYSSMFGHFSVDGIPWIGGTDQAEIVDLLSLVVDADRSPTVDSGVNTFNLRH